MSEAVTDSQLLESAIQQTEAALARIRAAMDAAEPGDFEHAPPGEWSATQILHHMTLSHEPYREALDALNIPAGDGPVRYRWLGKIIRKGLTRGGRVPAPARLVPPQGLDLAMVRAEWEQCHVAFAKTLEGLRGKRLSAVSMKNPNLPLFKIGACDAVAIYAAHLAYHEPQILARLSR
jgi:hypothetical protein